MEYRRQAILKAVRPIVGSGEGRPRDESLTEVMFKSRSEGGMEIGQVKSKGRRGILLKRDRSGEDRETLESSLGNASYQAVNRVGI